jgi:hypothetical protein
VTDGTWYLLATGALGGALFKGAIDFILESRQHRRASAKELRDDRRKAYVEFFAAADDMHNWGDRYRRFESEPVAGQNPDVRAAEAGAIHVQLTDVVARLNRALAVLDLLASPKVAAIASEFADYSDLPDFDPRRLEKLHEAMHAARDDLGVRGEWKQYMGAPPSGSYAYTPPATSVTAMAATHHASDSARASRSTK